MYHVSSIYLILYLFVFSGLNAIVAQDYGQFSYQIMVTIIIILGMLLNLNMGRQVLNARYLNSQGFRLHGTLLSHAFGFEIRAVEQMDTTSKSDE